MTPGDEAAQWLTGENPDELAVEIELPEWADDELVLLGAAPTLTYQADGQTYSHTFPPDAIVVAGPGGVIVIHKTIEVTDLGIEDD